MEKLNKRTGYLDTAKGIGILLVILGHIDVGMATSWLYSFHLPLFYIVSGICFNYYGNFKGYFIKKSKRCLTPYVFFGLLVVAVESFTGYLYSTGFKVNILMLIKQERYSTLWFLATLYIASLIFYLLIIICRNNSLLAFIISLVLSVIAVYIDQNYIRALPWNIDTAFIVLAFISFGYLLKEKLHILDIIESLKNTKRAVLAVILMILNLLLYIGNFLMSGRTLEMYWNSYGNYPMMFLSAVAGTLGVIILSKVINCKYLESLGRKSMTYFALHQSVFLWPFTLVLRKIGMITFKPGINNYISKVILLITVLVACKLTDDLIRKTKLRVILGETR